MKKRHSLAHLLAAAVLEKWPEAKLAIGPDIENGFYYDIDFQEGEGISEEDFKPIEKRMSHFIKQNLEFTKTEKEINLAITEAKTENNPYKLELLEDLEREGEKKVSYYSVAGFTDLCKGPHVSKTGEIALSSFKLKKLAGAYWRGDEKNKMLTRIYGLAFNTKEELEEYLKQEAEAEKRDHRKLAKELELFFIHEFAPGMPFFLAKGQKLLENLIEFVRKESYDETYQEVRSPQIINSDLWKISGHWDYYQEDMFAWHSKEDKTDLGVKPMNCPAHMLIYKNKLHSYRDLPYKLAETSTLYRNERSGTLHGLTRVRSLSQDDAHIFIEAEQIQGEVIELLNKVKRIYQIFNLKIDTIYLSTRPKDFLGEKELWDKAEKSLEEALLSAGLKYQINEGDGAFYGPKIDVNIKDAIGRNWQLATIQLDFQMPERFGLKYTSQSGESKVPVVIHRAILGSIERFLGIIIEHFAGAFPLWLSPVQIKLISVAKKHLDYSIKLANELKKEGFRLEIDSADETVSNKIRKAVKEKVPYILVIGDKEMEEGNLSLRERFSNESSVISLKQLISKLKKEIENYQI